MGYFAELDGHLRCLESLLGRDLSPGEHAAACDEFHSAQEVIAVAALAVHFRQLRGSKPEEDTTDG